MTQATFIIIGSTREGRKLDSGQKLDWQIGLLYRLNYEIVRFGQGKSHWNVITLSEKRKI